MKFLFTAFGLHNPYLSTSLPDHSIFPLSKEMGDELDLDYTALMIGNQFLIDKEAFEYVVSGERKFLTPMGSTLTTLKQEGLLETLDYGAIVNENRLLIDNKIEVMLQDPIPWFRIVQKQWSMLRDEFQRFHYKFGDPDNLDKNTIHSGVFNYLHSEGSVGRQKLRNTVEKLMSSNRSQYNKREIEHIQEIIRPLLGQILINDLIRTKLGQPFLDWDDAKDYYERLYVFRWEDSVDEIKLWHQASILFDAVIPDLKPNNIDEVIRFIRDDKAVRSMREELLKFLETGENISKEFFIRYANRVMQHELATKQKLKKYRLGGAALTSLIPGVGLLQEIGIAAAEEKIEDLVTDSQASKMRWYYALQREAASRIDEKSKDRTPTT